MKKVFNLEPFFFEVDGAILNYQKTWEFFRLHQFHLQLLIISAYIILLYGGTKIMARRSKFDNLDRVLLMWNLFLASFSIFASIRVWPQFLQVWKGDSNSENIYDSGFRATICTSKYEQSSVSYFWSFLFVMSKVPELVDTVFIILRKQKLIFLHYYHHMTVLSLAFYVCSRRPCGYKYYEIMNYTVHSVMYSYYALRVSKIVKIPKFVNITITFMQLSQMFIGFSVSLFIYLHRNDEQFLKNCFYDATMIKYGLAIYISYFILFLKFFIDTYLRPRQDRIKQN